MLDWCEDVTLIDSAFMVDGFGNQIEQPVKTQVMASKKEVSMNEFYSAAQAGIRPEVELIVHSFEYSGEQIVEYRGQRYSVIRTYQRSDDEIELYLERKASDG